jgi:hypothetical protein
MNSNGLFCFFLVMLFTSSFILLRAGGEREKNTLAFEIEKTSFERAMLEQNTDFLIRKSIENEIAFGLLNPLEIKKNVCKKLFDFFKENEGENQGIKKSFYFQDKSRLIKNRLSLEELEMNSIAVVVAKKKIVFAEFYYTGGLLKNNFLTADIESQGIIQKFMVPPEYSVRTVGVLP